MQIKYKTLCSDNFDIEFKLISSAEVNYIAQVGDERVFKRIKKSYFFSQRCYKYLKDHMLEPISLDRSEDGIVTALYRQKDVAMLENFLKNADDLWQYVIGKRLGRVLYQLHQCPLYDKDKIIQKRRSDKIIDNLASYLEKGHMRFENDSAIIEAISLRLTNLEPTKNVLLLGLVSLNNIFLTQDGVVILKPTYNFTIGDYSEDLASLTNECSREYPLFVAGALDGYFGQHIPAKFYVNYALYLAINIINRGFVKVSSMAKKGLKQGKSVYDSYVDKIDFLNYQFDDFKKPIPKFLLTKKLESIRTKCLERGL